MELQKLEKHRRNKSQTVLLFQPANETFTKNVNIILIKIWEGIAVNVLNQKTAKVTYQFLQNNSKVRRKEKHRRYTSRNP